MFALKERVLNSVVKYLRPWLLRDVFPELQISSSGLDLLLPHLEFDVDALNGSGMQSSPLLIKEAMKVENVRILLTPFRMPVLVIVVQGLDLVFQPRSAEDGWWQKKQEKTADQEQTAALLALDPQGASAHESAQKLAEGKVENTFITRFLANLALSCVKLEFRDCSVRVATHIQNRRQHICHFSLRSFVFGEVREDGFTQSGSLAGAVLTASHGVFKGVRQSASRNCSFRGLGLQVETRTCGAPNHGSRVGTESTQVPEKGAASEIEEIFQDSSSDERFLDTEGMSDTAMPEVSSKGLGKHVVLFEEIYLGFSFEELVVDCLELDAEDAAVGLDYEEMHAIQIVVGQVKGLPATPLKHDEKRQAGMEKSVELQENSNMKRNSVELWQRGIRKAMELSSRRCLTLALEAGIARRRYSSQYESWLLETGWGRKKVPGAGEQVKKSKSQQQHLQKLSQDMLETQKKLPPEGIALARRIARRRVSAAVHSKEAADPNASTSDDSENTSKMYSSFKVFLNMVWKWVALVTLFLDGKATNISGWLSATWKACKKQWQGFRGSKSEPLGDTPPEIKGESETGLDSSSMIHLSLRDEAERNGVENYFYLPFNHSVEGSGANPRKWAMTYALKIRRGSILLASAATDFLPEGEDIDSPSDQGIESLASSLIPAVHLNWDKLVLAYGSTGSASGASITCGGVKAEIVSILPSQMRNEPSENFDREVLNKEFVSLGRWAVKASDRASVLSSRPCPQKVRGDVHDLLLAEDLFRKHWTWQEQRLKVWARSWHKEGKVSNGDSWKPHGTIASRDGDDNLPFLVAEYNSSDEDPITQDCPGGLVNCSLAMGQLEFCLKGSFLDRISPLIDRHSVSPTDTLSDPTHTKNIDPLQSEDDYTLSKFWDKKYRVSMAKARDAMVSAIPGRSFLLTAVIDGPKIRLAASAVELVEFQQQGYQDGRKSTSPSDGYMGATVVADLGKLEFVMWPPSKNETRSEPGSSSGWRTHVLDSKVWLKRPPEPGLPQNFSDEAFNEHEQVANNLYVSLTGVALNLELRKETLRDLPVIEPVGLIMETSLCWDQFSSLFGTSKSVSASAGTKISSFTVHSYIDEVAIILQVVEFYMEGLKSKKVPDSTLVVKGGQNSSKFDSCAKEGDAVLDSSQNPAIEDEGCNSSFAGAFSMEIEKVRLVLGDTRLESAASCTRDGESGSQAEGLRYEPREGKLNLLNQDDNTFTNWEQKVKPANLGREAYISLGLLHIDSCLGDGIQMHFSSALKDAVMRLVDGSGATSWHDLTEMRKEFFAKSPLLPDCKVLTGLVLTEVALEKCSLKLFGLNPEQISSSQEDRVREVRGDQEPENEVVTVEQKIGRTGGPETKSEKKLSSHLSLDNLVDLGDSFRPRESSRGLLARSKSIEVLTARQLEEGSNSLSLNQVNKAGNAGLVKDEMHWLVAKLEVGKILVTDGLLDVLIAKVVLVANGPEDMHLDFGIDRHFKKISFSIQGGLVLLHTAALATVVQFFRDIGRLLARSRVLSVSSSKPTREPIEGAGLNVVDEESSQMPSLQRTFRSTSLPPRSSGKMVKQFKRTTSAPPGSQFPLTNAAMTSPPFGGVVFSKISGFSLVLARHSAKDKVPGEGVLFELEISTMLEVGENARRSSIDLTRFTILGLQERVPGNSKKTSGKGSSRTPQFGSSFKVASGSGELDGLSNEGDETTKPFRGNSSLAVRDRPLEQIAEEIKTLDADSVAPEKSDSGTRMAMEARGFRQALSEFNSFILERLSVSCVIERVTSERMWEWSNAWKGHCHISGFDFGITTSEIQLVGYLMSPLSSLTRSSGTSVAESAANGLLEGSMEESDDSEFDIPDGSIIAIKDVHEHCYLAAEEIPTKKGHHRLVGVLHYTLAGDKALFKVKYQDPSTTRSNTTWFSLASLHARDSNGEPFRVHYRPGSGQVDISSTNNSSWEQWRLVPIEASQDEDKGELDIQNPVPRNLFHLVNQKSKTGIAFDENVPLLVKQPGNPFKLKVVTKPSESSTESHEAEVLTKDDETPLQAPALDDHGAVSLVTAIPHVICKFETFVFTILHEAAGGLHVLPLLRARIPATEGVVQMGSSKTRTILQCGIVLEYYEMQTSLWVPIVNPIETDVFYRARNVQYGIVATKSRKTPVALFSRFRKVEFLVSEPSLDAILFLIGALDLAGPFTVKNSPVTANRCLIENHTGVDLLCRFDQGSARLDGMIPPWHSDSFLMRRMSSRRDTNPAKVASSLELYLQQPGGGATTSPVVVTLDDPGVISLRTRLKAFEGRKGMSPGPMVVVDVSRRKQEGILVTVSSVVRIQNATGLLLELRCRRNKDGQEGAVVVLEDGDMIDDSMGAFDALNLQGELKKALSSLSIGNYLLSIRPTQSSSTVDSAESDKMKDVESTHDWSDDVKGAKIVRAGGLFDKLQYTFKMTMKVRNVDSRFGVVFCPSKVASVDKASEKTDVPGLYFLIRTTSRQVPVSRPKAEKEQEQQPGRYAVVAWREQQEILLLPTVRVINLMTSDIAIILSVTSEGKKKGGNSQETESVNEESVQAGGKVCMYINLGDLCLTVKYGHLTSKPVNLGVGSKEFSQSAKDGNLKGVEMIVDFRDGLHTALVMVSRGEDGVLEVIISTRYILHNLSHVTLLCCPANKSSPRWRGFRSSNELEWPSSGTVTNMAPFSRASWFQRSTKLLVKRTEADAEAALLDIESLSGSMEISLRVPGQDSVDNRIQLGVAMHLPSAGDSNSACTIRLVPRYIVANESGEAILICQDGFQDDASAMVTLEPGERSAVHAQVLPEQMGGHSSRDKNVSGSGNVGPEVLLTLRFRPKDPGWNWSGPVCASALGSFSVKIRRPQSESSTDSLPFGQEPQMEGLWFAVADVQESASSLIMTFRRQSVDAIPYHIENATRSTSITYNQQGLNDSEVLKAGASVRYVWDDLGLPHKLTVKVAGTPMSHDINLDKLRSWKSFRAVRRKKGLMQIPFLNELQKMALYGDDPNSILPNETIMPAIGYEVYAAGPTRVLRICEERDSRVDRRWQSDISKPKQEIELRIPLFTMSILEPAKQQGESEEGGRDVSEALAYVPIIALRLTNLLIEALITPEYTLCQLKAERLDVDVKWPGAPVAAMLRGHSQDRFAKGLTVLHMAVVMANLGSNPIQLKYASILLQAMDLNLDEDTLMKLAPFYRISLSESTAPSRRIYFERFEIHPIKIVGSFLPGNPRADYSSGQETLRALLHSVIKIPAVRGTSVELNGVLLSHALLTFKQLAIKCAQHYSWYAMRAIYIARGSKLLPPGFASLFDDSAASSLDVFFDPSNGSIDLQGLTLGMFGVLSRGLRKQGKQGTQRYLGNLEDTVKAAGSNLLFAVITEVSDSVLKGADANGFDGVVTGFRRGIVNVAMKPSVLRSAVIQGGATRRIRLDRIVGTDEAYIEGYLQAMLDALFKQNYLRVKVIDDQVVLKNLPPNTTLMDEIVGCVKNFLIGEGLLAGESSAAALSSLRRLRGENDRRIGPTLLALCEQLVVIIVVRSLRRQTIRVLHQHNVHVVGEEESQKPAPAQVPEEDPQNEDPSKGGFFSGINYKRAVTGFFISSVLAYADGRVCRHIPNPLVRRIVSGFLLSFVE